MKSRSLSFSDIRMIGGTLCYDLLLRKCGLPWAISKSRSYNPTPPPDAFCLSCMRRGNFADCRRCAILWFQCDDSVAIGYTKKSTLELGIVPSVHELPKYVQYVEAIRLNRRKSSATP